MRVECKQMQPPVTPFLDSSKSQFTHLCALSAVAGGLSPTLLPNAILTAGPRGRCWGGLCVRGFVFDVLDGLPASVPVCVSGRFCCAAAPAAFPSVPLTRLAASAFEVTAADLPPVTLTPPCIEVFPSAAVFVVLFAAAARAADGLAPRCKRAAAAAERC